MPKRDYSLSFVLPPTPWINRKVVLWSAATALVIEVAIIWTTGWAIYTKHSDSPWTRLVSGYFTYPAAAISGTVIPYDRFSWEVRSRLYYTAVHDQSPSKAETETFVLRQLLNRTLYRQLLKDNGIEISQDDVEQQLEAVTNEVGGPGNLKAFLTENYGETMGMNQFRLLLSDSLVEAAVQQRLLVRATVRHILVTVPENADQATIDAGKKRAEDIKGKIADPAKFGEIAKQYSDDIRSRDNDGNLGITVRGESTMYGTEFEQAVFSSTIGEVVGPVRSPYGWHIIMVDKREGSIDKSLEDLTKELRAAANTRVYITPKD